MSQSKHSKISTKGGESLSENPFSSLDAVTLGAAGHGVGAVQPSQSSLTNKKKMPQKSKGRVEVRREKAGRGGKTVTTLKEFPSHIPLSSLEAMTFELKKICACGGTLKGRVVELQGDVCDRVCRELNQRGYRAVRAGG
jgi:translation initiation factor 1